MYLVSFEIFKSLAEYDIGNALQSSSTPDKRQVMGIRIIFFFENFIFFVVEMVEKANWPCVSIMFLVSGCVLEVRIAGFFD